MKEIIRREVGERVDVMFNIDQSTVKDTGGGSFSATVTTSALDRMQESIDTEGITTDAYMQNPVVLYGHDYQGLPIGKATKLTQFKNKLNAVFQLAVDEYPFAATVAAMIKGGYLNAVSIGGIVKEWSEDYTTIKAMEMVEFSVVPVPANPQALISSRSFEEATGKSVEEVAKEFHQFVQQSVADKVKHLDTDELNRHISTLESLTAILKATVGTETSAEAGKVTLTIRRTAGKVSQTGLEIIKLVKKEGK